MLVWPSVASRIYLTFAFESSRYALVVAFPNAEALKVVLATLMQPTAITKPMVSTPFSAVAHMLVVLD